MLEDIVVDTNVLVHAGDSTELYFDPAERFLTTLKNTQTLICVDEGFDINESKNSSYIWHDYLQHLRAGSVGLVLVTLLATTGRVRILSKQVDSVTSRR